MKVQTNKSFFPSEGEVVNFIYDGKRFSGVVESVDNVDPDVIWVEVHESVNYEDLPVVEENGKMFYNLLIEDIVQ